MIKLEDACFAYSDKPVLSHINIDVACGEFVVIKGDNGCGKTTLLNIINALEFCDKGKYIFDGIEINQKYIKNPERSKELHRRIGYIFQNSDAQLFCSSVEEEIAFAPNQIGLSKDEVYERVEDMLKLMDIQDIRKRAPFHLSMGEKKKVAIASVLAANPEVLTLDEPMNFLDKKSREWIQDFLLKLKGIKTIVVVSHTDHFDKMADRIINI